MKKIEGNVRLANIIKILFFVFIILGLAGMIIGIVQIRQAREERKDISSINALLDEKGLSDELKSKITEFISKYPQTKNIVVTDKDKTILYSVNKDIIGENSKFEIEREHNNPNFFIGDRNRKILFIEGNRVMMPSGDMYGLGDKKLPMGFGMKRIRIESKPNFDNDKDINRIEFHKTNPSKNILFINNYSSAAKGLNIHYISNGFREGGLIKTILVTNLLLRLVGLSLWILTALWVYKNSKNRGLNPVFWGILTILSGPIGFIAYLTVRHWVKFCGSCGVQVKNDMIYCHNCGAATKNRCTNCGQMMELDWKYCSHCGAKKEEI